MLKKTDLIRPFAAIFFVSALLLCTSLLRTASALDVNDLSHPSSVAVDPKTGDMFISNINGLPFEKDNNGFITKVSSDGLVVVQKFIEAKKVDDKPAGAFELHAPKGLILDGGVLYVTDIDAVKCFKPDTGEFIRTIDLTPLSPKSLNDITADLEGHLFVSDAPGNKIIRIDTKNADAAEVWKEAAFLGQPNGLLFNRFTKGLMVAAWEGGEIYELDRVGKIRKLRGDLEGLDGLASDGKGTIYVSSYTKGEIYMITNWGRGDLSLFRSGLNTPAYVHYDPFLNELRVPLTEGNSVVSIPVAERKPRTHAKSRDQRVQ